MNQKGDFIGVFDSGVGGISVLRHLRKLLPNERFLYYGDSANAPYGRRTTAQVEALTLAAAEKMMAFGLKALVVACNTATAAAIHTLRQTYPELIVVGIEPALKPAVDQFPTGRIGVMATQVTLREEKFDSLMHRYENTAIITKIPAPGLVELVETGKADAPETEALLSEILSPYAGKLDALVLGCTHYPLATGAVRKVLGPRIVLLDGGEGTARETHRRLQEAGLLEEGEGCVQMENSSGQQLPDWNCNTQTSNDKGLINIMYLDMTGGKNAFSKELLAEDYNVVLRLKFRLRGSVRPGDVLDLIVEDAVFAASDEAQSLAMTTDTLKVKNGRLVIGE